MLHAPASLGRSSSPVLVGRAGALDRLREAAARPPAVVLVEGEAGVGKTRLVEELAAVRERAGQRTVIGRCLELREPFPLGPVLEAVRGVEVPELPAVAGALRPFLPELADRLPPAPAPLGDPGAERHRLFRGLHALLTGLGPALLLIEDLHWADEPTLDFLRFLATRPPPGLVLAGTYRREDLGRGSSVPRLDGRRIVLQPLDPDDVRELVRAILDTDEVSEAFADYLFRRTAGLPLAVEEVLLLLRQRRELVYREGTWVRQQLEALEVPPRLRDAIGERLDRLDPAARDVARAAAVLAQPAGEPLLVRIAGLTDQAGTEGLAEALGAALLFEAADGRIAFRHALARQAVEEEIPAPVRRRLHLRAARALESTTDKPLARLAHHYRAAGETTTWVRYAEAAADRAVSQHDHAAAYALLREAVALRTLPPATRGRLALRLARHAARCREYEDAVPALRSLVEDEAIRGPLRGRLRFWLARMLYDAGAAREAHEEATRALADLDGPPAAQVMSWLAVTPSGGPVAERLGWLDRALDLSARTDDRAMRREIAATRAVLLARAGDPACWPAIAELPRPGGALPEIEQAMRAHGNTADALLHLGHYGKAAELNRYALGLAREHAPPFAKNFEMTSLQLDLLTGRWGGLEERLRADIRAVEDWPTAVHLCTALLGLLLLAQGKTQPASHALQPLADRLDSDTHLLTWVVAGLARIRLAQRDPRGAAALVAPVLRTVEETGMWLSAAELAPVGVEALLAAGRRAPAVLVVERLAAALAERDAPAAAAALSVCRGLLHEDAREFLIAERAWAALPRPYEAARARVRAGLCLLAAEPGRGQELLLSGLTTFQELGAGWDVEFVRQALRRNGMAPPHRRGRRSYGNRLSPREEQVAHLAASGLQNREIAGALHLSVKTVEGHLSSATRKLGASPRGPAN